VSVILRALAASKYILLALIVAVLLLVVATMSFSRTEAQGQENQQADSESAEVVSSGETTSRQQAAIENYWTEERMRNAKPMEITADGPPEKPSGTAASLPDGPAVKVPPVAPGGGSVSGASSTEVQPTALTTDGYTYPAPFTRYEVFSAYTAAQYRTNGKLFFTQNGTNFVCSATAVNSGPSTDPGNLSTVWTAGHCVSDGAGAFSTNVIFVPAYKDGSAPYGQWTQRQLWTLSEWHFNGNLRQDLGAIVVNKDLNGNTLQRRIGAKGIAFNLFPVQHWNSFGYPAASPFNGQRQHLCQASYARSDAPNAGPGPNTIGIGCDMTGGSSGGGWVLNFSKSGGFVNSVNSYKYIFPNEPLQMYGPYHGSEAKLLYDSARKS